MKRNISVYSFLFAFSFYGLLYGVDDSGSSGVTQKPRTVPQVDLNRYVGIWYEIAKIPNRFQKKCARDTTAEYKMRPDGRIQVINRCIDKNGKLVEARGIAKIAEPETNSKLKVSFVRVLGIQLFWGDYWIIGLQNEYQYAVVGDSKRKYGWILSRRPSLTDEEWLEIRNILEKQGYRPESFVATQHSKKNNHDRRLSHENKKNCHIFYIGSNAIIPRQPVIGRIQMESGH